MGWFKENNIIFHLLRVFEFQTEQFGDLQFSPTETNVFNDKYIKFYIFSSFNNEKYSISIKLKDNIIDIIITNSDNTKIITSRKFNYNDKPYDIVNQCLNDIVEKMQGDLK